MLVDDPSMPEDYEVNEKVSVLFLSLAYHVAYPLYIKGKLEDLYKHRKYRNRILLLLNDDKDEQNMVNALMMECFKYETTVIMCWSFDEAA